jgi:hypothetical protein
MKGHFIKAQTDLNYGGGSVSKITGNTDKSTQIELFGLNT